MCGFEEEYPKKRENDTVEEAATREEASEAEEFPKSGEKEMQNEAEPQEAKTEAEAEPEIVAEAETESRAEQPDLKYQEKEREGMPCPSVREYHYEEKVKKTSKKKNGWAKFIAACLIVSIVGGASIGAGYGTVNHYFQQKNGVPVSAVTDTEKASFLTDGLSTVDIVKKVKPSVVSISTTMTGAAKYFGKYVIPYEAEGAGSGVVFYQDEDRVAIITNNHVIENATSIYVTFDGDKSVAANVIGTKSESDLAVLSVSWEDLKQIGVKEVTTATFGDSDALEVGECVIAIGNAMGKGLSATDGIISMTEQTINVDGNTLGVLQTSAAINGGNSGGALVNSKGEVIGINTAKYNSAMAEGMGYAIPSNTITPIMESLLKNGTQPKAYIGITGTSITEENAPKYNLPVGALIMEVVEKGPADRAGVQVGDVITQFDGKAVMGMDQLASMINETAVGKTVTIHVLRDGNQDLDLKLTIGDKNS